MRRYFCEISLSTRKTFATAKFAKSNDYCGRCQKMLYSMYLYQKRKSVKYELHTGLSELFVCLGDLLSFPVLVGHKKYPILDLSRHLKYQLYFPLVVQVELWTFARPCQALCPLFHIKGAKIFQKETTSRPFQATQFRTRSRP